MSVIICKPKDISDEDRSKILALITAGEQVPSNGLEDRLLNAELIAYKRLDDNKIVCTATLKNPNVNYKQGVFTEASAKGATQYLYELGYIATHSSYENKGYCKEVLSSFLPKITAPIYATTRKASMIHILKKYGFDRTGSVYKGDLVLLIREKDKV